MADLVKHNPVNDPTQKPVKNHSNFKPNYSLYGSYQFGLNTPSFVMEVLADDRNSLRSLHDVDTLSLKAPVMMPVKKSTDSFMVPLRAILPRTAELLITNPLRGDDVQADDVNCGISSAMLKQFLDRNHTILQQLFAAQTIDSTWTLEKYLTTLLLCYRTDMMVTSVSALPKYLGYNFNRLYKYYYTELSTMLGDDVEVDHFWERVMEGLFSSAFDAGMQSDPSSYYFEVTMRCPVFRAAASSDNISVGSWKNKVYRVHPAAYKNKFYNPARDITLPDLLAMILSEPGLPVVTDISNCALNTIDITTSDFSSAVLGMSSLVLTSRTYDEEFVNLSRLAAYQLACAEFYTNDKVDDVYSASLYRENLWNLIRFAVTTRHTFDYNGMQILFDAFSAYMLNHALLNYPSNLWTDLTNFLDSLQQGSTYFGDPYQLPVFLLVQNIFGFTRSLRYEDYFVGSRPNPLAVGNVNVNVQSGAISVIDVTKNIQVQRFLNQVNRTGRKFGEYVRGILGDTPLKDAHEPIFLAHIADTIGGEETDNTGDAQMSLGNSTTSKFRSNVERYQFVVESKEPSIIISIINYDIPRVYRNIMDRQNFHIDRFDMFNPFMQFVGDQPVYQDELDPQLVKNSEHTFGYQLRYAEYKNRVDTCAGAFAVDALPGYAKIYDPKSDNIDSDFIRSQVGELDEFYVSLTGLTPAFRPNFIIRVDNSVSSTRPMVFAPSIL